MTHTQDRARSYRKIHQICVTTIPSSIWQYFEKNKTFIWSSSSANPGSVPPAPRSGRPGPAGSPPLLATPSRPPAAANGGRACRRVTPWAGPSLKQQITLWACLPPVWVEFGHSPLRSGFLSLSLSPSSPFPFLRLLRFSSTRSFSSLCVIPSFSPLFLSTVTGLVPIFVAAFPSCTFTLRTENRKNQKVQKESKDLKKTFKGSKESTLEETEDVAAFPTVHPFHRSGFALT